MQSVQQNDFAEWSDVEPFPAHIVQMHVAGLVFFQLSGNGYTWHWHDASGFFAVYALTVADTL